MVKAVGRDTINLLRFFSDSVKFPPNEQKVEAPPTRQRSNSFSYLFNNLQMNILFSLCGTILLPTVNVVRYFYRNEYSIMKLWLRVGDSEWIEFFHSKPTHIMSVESFNVVSNLNSQHILKNWLTYGRKIYKILLKIHDLFD